MKRVLLAVAVVAIALVLTAAAAAAPTTIGTASQKLKVDQSNTVTSPEGLGLGHALYGQTFVPRAHNLAQVDLLLTVNILQSPGAMTTVGLFSDITQPPLATASAFVTPPAPGELARTVSFRFDPPIPIDRGTTYTIGWYGPPDNIWWQFSYGDPYPRGQAVGPDGVPLNPSADFVFTTYRLTH
jgi:hypothetical protein